MTEPQRLKDKHAGKLESALLGSAGRDAPLARARGRTLLALGLGATAAGLPAATTAAAGAKTVASVALAAAAKWGGIGLAVGVLTMGALYEGPKLIGRPAASHSASAPRAAPSRSGIVSEVEGAPIPVTDTPPAPADAPAAVDEVAPQPRTAPIARGARRTVPPLVDNRGGLRLAEEVAALDGVRQITAIQPEEALRLLDEYDRRFPQGDLGPEALVLRIDALVHDGQRGAADALATDYLARHPGSPHAKRIRTTLAGRDEAR